MADHDNDVEKASVASTTRSARSAGRTPPPVYPLRSSQSSQQPFNKYIETETAKVQKTMFRRAVDSFKRAPGTMDENGKLSDHNRGFDYSHAARATANSRMARRLKGRHMQMIAIGGCIGMSRGD
jgi:amino acid permease